MLEMPYDCGLLGVVPVFVNAGAALLPAILAGLTSILSVLFRPRALWNACRAHPDRTVAILLVLAGMGIGAVWLAAPAGVNAARRKTAGPQTLIGGQAIDWAAVALQWIREDQLAAANTAGSSRQAATATGPERSRPLPAEPTIFGGGPLRNGYGGGGSPVGLVTAWEFPRPGTKAAEELEGALFFASPAVVGDAVYGGSCLIDVRNNYGTLFCLDAATGNVRWLTSVYQDAKGKEIEFKGFFSSPAVTADGNYLVVGEGLHSDDNCELVCVNAKTGRLHWAVQTPLHIEGSPAIDGDVVLAGAGAIESGDDHKAKGHPGLVIAVKVSSGEKLWEYRLADPESSPIVREGMAYIGSGFNGNAVVALRMETDEELKRKGLDRLAWRATTPHPATGAITLAGELVLAGCGNGDYVFGDPHPDGAVIALDRKTGHVRWQRKMPDGVLGRIAVCDNRAIVPIRNGQVAAVDLAGPDGGRPLWRQQINGEKAVLAGPAFTGKYVYAVSQDGFLAVLDARDGKVLEKHYLNAKGKPGEMGLSVSSPTIAGGRVYVGSETGGLRCFVGKEIKP